MKKRPVTAAASERLDTRPLEKQLGDGHFRALGQLRDFSMPLKAARDCIEKLVREVRPPWGMAISLTERTPQNENDTNWIPGAGAMPMDAVQRYSDAVAELRKQHPRIDWTGITELDGERRRIARWLSEVEG